MHSNLFSFCFSMLAALGVAVPAGSAAPAIFPHSFASSYTASVPASYASTTALTAGAGVRIPIFIYHSVKHDKATDTQAQRDYSVTPEMFEEQLQYLQQNGYTTISMSEFARELRAGTTSSIQKPVVLGFDDGWENQYVYALPLLEKYHMKAVFYIYTNPPTIKDPRFMSWEQIKALDAAGMEIADHTVTHPYLQLLTPEKLAHEVVDSKKELESKLGKPVLHFASPFGYTSPQLVALLQTAGFETARTGNPGAQHAATSTLTLTAYYVHRDLQDFAWILTHAK